MVKNPPTKQAGFDLGLIPGSGRSLRVGNGNPLQDSYLEDPWTEELSPRGRQSQTQLSTH